MSKVKCECCGKLMTPLKNGNSLIFGADCIKKMNESKQCLKSLINYEIKAELRDLSPLADFKELVSEFNETLSVNSCTMFLNTIAVNFDNVVEAFNKSVFENKGEYKINGTEDLKEYLSIVFNAKDVNVTRDSVNKFYLKIEVIR